MQTFKDYEYTRPDLEAKKQEIMGLIEQFEQADSSSEQIELIKQITAIRDHISSNMQLAYTRASINTNDPFYSAERDYFDDNGATVSAIESSYSKALLASRYIDELKAHFGEQLFSLAYNEVNTYSDDIKDLLNEENKIASSYSKLMASAEIEFDGKVLNLAELSAYEQSKDRETRKAALLARQEFMGEKRDEIDEIYDALVKIRTKIARTLGYDNFIELGYMRMQRIDYNQEMVKNYRDQIAKHLVPLATKLYQHQAARIGVNELKFYDEPIMFLDGNEDPKDDPETILKNGEKMYNELSPETAEFYQFMMERELFDVLSKKGKEMGGYCTYFDDYKSPFIFANFNTTDHDITVLTHEAGHAFQVYQSRELDISEYLWPTHESCEIHSMSMEFFTYPWMALFFNNPDKFKYKHVVDSIRFLPYGVAVDEFQHRVYENPDMTKEERRAVWTELEEKYLPHRDYDHIMPLAEGSFWHKQGHIFSSPFYYIDYTLAQVCAFQFFRRSTEDFEAAWQDYLHICKIGGSLPFTEIVRAAHLKSPFDQGTIEDIVTYLEDYIASIDTTEF